MLLWTCSVSTWQWLQDMFLTMLWDLPTYAQMNFVRDWLILFEYPREGFPFAVFHVHCNPSSLFHCLWPGNLRRGMHCSSVGFWALPPLRALREARWYLLSSLPKVCILNFGEDEWKNRLVDVVYLVLQKDGRYSARGLVWLMQSVVILGAAHQATLGLPLLNWNIYQLDLLKAQLFLKCL